MFGIASAFAPSSTRIYLYTHDVDMRKSLDGLCGIVQAEFARDIRDSDLFLFLNRRGDRIKAMYWDRRGDRIKAMYWDRHGIAIWMKRLERGTIAGQNIDQTGLRGLTCQSLLFGFAKQDDTGVGGDSMIGRLDFNRAIELGLKKVTLVFTIA